MLQVINSILFVASFSSVEQPECRFLTDSTRDGGVTTTGAVPSSQDDDDDDDDEVEENQHQLNHNGLSSSLPVSSVEQGLHMNHQRKMKQRQQHIDDDTPFCCLPMKILLVIGIVTLIFSMYNKKEKGRSD